MLETYRRVFAHRGALAFSGAGWVARLPISMMTLGIVLLISATTGSYALAGQVSAAYVIGNAVVAIPHGRLADRFGQTAVLYADTVLFGVATGMLVHATTHGWGTPWPHVFAALSGVGLPQVGSLVRARWVHLVNSHQERHTAFAVEAIGDEVVFVTGPALVTFLSTLHAPQTGLLVALAVGTIGTVALALQPGTAPPAQRDLRQSGAVPLPWLRLAPIAAAALALGGLFGAIEVATVAFAADGGHKSWSGALLAVFSLGSLLAGVISGALRLKTSDLHQLRTGIGLLAAAMFVLPFINGLFVLGGVLLVIGFTLAPTLIALVSFLERSTPVSRLTEAMAVFQTGISAGIAPGAYFAGVLADQHGGAAAYWVCAASGVCAVLAALLCRPAASLHP